MRKVVKQMTVVVVVGALALTTGVSGAVPTGDRSTAATESAAASSEVEIYEHRTGAGDELHTISLPPEAVGETPSGVLGIVVVPERDRVCQSIDGEGYEAADAGCMQSESMVDAYLQAAAVERTSSGDYTTA
jgi:hypothetical protein